MNDSEIHLHTLEGREFERLWLPLPTCFCKSKSNCTWINAIKLCPSITSNPHILVYIYIHVVKMVLYPGNILTIPKHWRENSRLVFQMWNLFSSKKDLIFEFKGIKFICEPWMALIAFFSRISAIFVALTLTHIARSGALFLAPICQNITCYCINLFVLTDLCYSGGVVRVFINREPTI